MSGSELNEGKEIRKSLMYSTFYFNKTWCTLANIFVYISFVNETKEIYRIATVLESFYSKPTNLFI